MHVPFCLYVLNLNVIMNFSQEVLLITRNHGYSLVNGIIPLDASIYLFIVPNGSVLIIFPSSRLDH